jgi:hypothetical protein
MTDYEFIQTNPVQASSADAIFVDHPADQPPFIGVRITGGSKMDPRTTVHYSFKFTREQADALSAELAAASRYMG